MQPRKKGKFDSTHGLHHTGTYQCWADMKRRCFNPLTKGYKNYGGRGITVCRRWVESFEYFLKDMGIRPDGMTIERINNNGDYDPSNCKWATHKEQHRNKRTCHILEYEGRKLPLVVWAEVKNLTIDNIFSRLKAGWSVSSTLDTPVGVKRK